MVIISGIDPLGQPYSLACGMTGPEADLRDGDRWGDNVGDPSIIAALRVYEGDPVPLSPSGPMTPLAPNDHHSIIAWLGQNSVVLDAEGDAGTDSRLDETDSGVEY